MSIKDQRIEDLLSSYDSVGNLIDKNIDLKMADLMNSRSFFLNESINEKKPKPREVDVYAILSGISFYKESQEFIKKIILQLENILQEEIFYFVSQENLGVEYAVIKWPDDSYDQELIKNSKKFLDQWKGDPFCLRIVGIQIHIDGCIVLKGVDLGSEIYEFRKMLFSKVTGLPVKQSSWAHIPLGRVLAPVGEEKMKQLKALIGNLNRNLVHDVLIDKIHMVNEKRWYMEEKNYLHTKLLK